MKLRNILLLPVILTVNRAADVNYQSAFVDVSTMITMLGMELKENSRMSCLPVSPLPKSQNRNSLPSSVMAESLLFLDLGVTNMWCFKKKML